MGQSIDSDCQDDTPIQQGEQPRSFIRGYRSIAIAFRGSVLFPGQCPYGSGNAHNAFFSEQPTQEHS